MQILNQEIMECSLTGIRNVGLNPLSIWSCLSNPQKAILAAALPAISHASLSHSPSRPISLNSYITGGCTQVDIVKPACSFSQHREFEDAAHVEAVWKSLSSSDIRTLKYYFCYWSHSADKALIARLLYQPNQYSNQVVEKMGASNLGQFPVTEFYPQLTQNFALMRIITNNQILMGQLFAFVLNGWSKAFTVQEVLGAMAHEIAHHILKHDEKDVALWLESNSIPVESLSDVTEFMSALESQCEELPKKKSVKRLCQNFINFVNRHFAEISQKPDFYNITSEMLESVRQSQSPKTEKEADLLTMRDPFLARGLRDFLVRRIEICEKIPGADCSLYYKDSQTHPSTVSRIQYMTRALCEEYPKENSDICSRADLLRYRSNSTCPKVDISDKWQW